jgi:hypothetical protein
MICYKKILIKVANIIGIIMGSKPQKRRFNFEYQGRLYGTMGEKISGKILCLHLQINI